jgi:hypothetical protein
MNIIRLEAESAIGKVGCTFASVGGDLSPFLSRLEILGMKITHIIFDVPPGSTIDDAAKFAVVTCQRFGCACQFDFNGVVLIVGRNVREVGFNERIREVVRAWDLRQRARQTLNDKVSV